MIDWFGKLEQFWIGLSEFFAGDMSRLLEPDIIFRVVLQIALFVASAFFSGSETALFSLSRLDLRELRRARSPYAEFLHTLLDEPRRLIISILCGNQIVNVAAAANMMGILVALYDVDRAAVISVFVMVPLLLLFGEATPKTIAVSDPVGVSTRIVARPMSLWVKFSTPLNWIIRGIADRITTSIVGEQRAPENILQVDEFRTLVEEGVLRGELSATESALIYNLLQAGSSEIVEIMTPRTRMFFIDGNRPVSEIVDTFMAHRHDRVPVYKNDRDNVVGFLHAEDILQLVLDKAEVSALSLEDLLRPPVMVPLTKKIDEMFDYFQSRDVQAAIALNEFGGVDGLLTMNDVLTFIFGRPQAELPLAGVTYDSEVDNYEVPGEMKLVDFNKVTNYGIEDPRMTTIGGVLLRHLDRLPRVGDTLALNDIVFSVVKMAGNRVARVQASRKKLIEGSAQSSESSLNTGETSRRSTDGQP